MIGQIASQTGIHRGIVLAILYEAAGHYISFLESNDQWHLGRHTGLLRGLVLQGADNNLVADACNIIAKQRQESTL